MRSSPLVQLLVSTAFIAMMALGVFALSATAKNVVWQVILDAVGVAFTGLVVLGVYLAWRMRRSR